MLTYMIPNAIVLTLLDLTNELLNDKRLHFSLVNEAPVAYLDYT